MSWIGRGELREIEALIAWNGELTDVAAAAIAGARDAETLEFVDLSWNAIGADGAAALASSTTLRCLKRLRLYHNALGSAGAQRLAETRHGLEFLNVCGNQIGDAGVEALAAGELRGLRDLALGWNDLGAPAARAIASGPWRSLARLNIRANRLGPDAVAELVSGALAELIWLGLDENPLGNAGLLALLDAPGFARLEWLNLGGTELDDRVVAPALARLTGMAVLALRELRLHDNELSAASVDALAAALPGCQVIS